MNAWLLVTVILTGALAALATIMAGGGVLLALGAYSAAGSTALVGLAAWRLLHVDGPETDPPGDPR